MNDPKDVKADSSEQLENASTVTPSQEKSVAVHITDSVARPEALNEHCPEHPDQTAENSPGGFGLAGGGFGAYSICNICGRIFNKFVIPDDEDF